MSYCTICGHKLTIKELEHEGMVPYCDICEEYRFPVFNTAVSMIVLNSDKDKILLIQQYGKENNILVAGYVNKEECLEDALMRELKEEIGLETNRFQYMKSEYFDRSNTLICNFAVVATSENLDLVSEWEVDQAAWFTFEEARQAVKPCSLAQRFLFNFFNHWNEIQDKL